MAGTAVIYAAKSTKDERGSIPTQLADCRAAAETEGLQIAGEYSDENASAYKGNRGSGLSDAKDHAIRVSAELWVQHPDRLARGDGITADHLAEVWFALRRHRVRLRSVQDDSNLEDAIRVVLSGERNHEDSKRKSEAIQRGLKRRKDRAQPVRRSAARISQPSPTSTLTARHAPAGSRMTPALRCTNGSSPTTSEA
jgi:DNA invertase Pin-like site-specific DNA recombinase